MGNTWNKVWLVSSNAGVECALNEASAKRLFRQKEKSFWAEERTNLKMYAIDLDTLPDIKGIASKYNAIKPTLYNTLSQLVLGMGNFDIKEIKSGLTIYGFCYNKDRNSIERNIALTTLNKALSVFHKEHPDIQMRVRVDDALYKVIKAE